MSKTAGRQFKLSVLSKEHYVNGSHSSLPRAACSLSQRYFCIIPSFESTSNTSKYFNHFFVLYSQYVSTHKCESMCMYMCVLAHLSFTQPLFVELAGYCSHRCKPQYVKCVFQYVPYHFSVSSSFHAIPHPFLIFSQLPMDTLSFLFSFFLKAPLELILHH